jgi:hypothetical protein
MYEYVYLGSSPCDEECAQVGSNNYSERERKEIRAYIGQLTRILELLGFKQETWPDSFALVRKSESHDFGSYAEVCAKFRDDDEDACNLAYVLESNLSFAFRCLVERNLAQPYV